ncbi:MAG: DUF4177 domain-containing protein [Acidobacteria bacterium]|nr:DUF4177 domain-containing protein [Acidobacteriota bacterium]
MWLKRLGLAVAFAAALLCLVGLTGYAQRGRPRRPAWEYKAATFSNYLTFEKEINELGAQGWELVAVSDVAGTTNYFFKRPR